MHLYKLIGLKEENKNFYIQQYCFNELCSPFFIPTIVLNKSQNCYLFCNLDRYLTKYIYLSSSISIFSSISYIFYIYFGPQRKCQRRNSSDKLKSVIMEHVKNNTNKKACSQISYPPPSLLACIMKFYNFFVFCICIYHKKKPCRFIKQMLYFKNTHIYLVFVSKYLIIQYILFYNMFFYMTRKIMPNS